MDEDELKTIGMVFIALLGVVITGFLLIRGFGWIQSMVSGDAYQGR